MPTHLDAVLPIRLAIVENMVCVYCKGGGGDSDPTLLRTVDDAIGGSVNLKTSRFLTKMVRPRGEGAKYIISVIARLMIHCHPNAAAHSVHESVVLESGCRATARHTLRPSFR